MNQPNVVSNGILSSPMDEMWEPIMPCGSFYKTIAKILHEHLDLYGDWNFLTNCITKEILTASQFEVLAKKFSIIFSQYGLSRGGTVHLVTGNHNFSYSVSGGAWILGARSSHGSIDMDSKGIADQLLDTDASIVMTVPATAETVLRAVKLMNYNDNEKVTVFCLGNFTGCINVFDLLDEVNEDDAPEPLDALDVKKDTAIILWSSGTVGLPKGVLHSHFSILNILGSLQNLIIPHSTMLATTCFFHVGGFFTGINAIMKHQTYFHMFGQGSTFELFLTTAKRVQPRSLTMGSHHYVQLCESPILELLNPEDFKSVKIIFPAGASVPQQCEAVIREKFHNLQAVLNIYGQTETGICVLGTNQINLGTILSTVKVKIEDTDTGEPCGANEIGEICLKNCYTMTAYLKRPKQTKDFFDKEGFARTGDLGYFDENGDLFFVDRMKELIKFQNSHIAPTELEGILQSHPAVQDCLIFGKKDARVQELVTAVVVLKPTQQKVTEEHLLEFFNQQVADFKKLRGGIIFREKIPRNIIGKLLRREMRDWAEKQQPQLPQQPQQQS